MRRVSRRDGEAVASGHIQEPVSTILRNARLESRPCKCAAAHQPQMPETSLSLVSCHRDFDSLIDGFEASGLG